MNEARVRREDWKRNLTYGIYFTPASSRLATTSDGSYIARIFKLVRFNTLAMATMDNIERNDEEEETYRSNHFNSICSGNVSFQPLPSSDPAGAHVR